MDLQEPPGGIGHVGTGVGRGDALIGPQLARPHTAVSLSTEEITTALKTSDVWLNLAQQGLRGLQTIQMPSAEAIKTLGDLTGITAGPSLQYYSTPIQLLGHAKVLCSGGQWAMFDPSRYPHPTTDMGKFKNFVDMSSWEVMLVGGGIAVVRDSANLGKRTLAMGGFPSSPGLDSLAKMSFPRVGAVGMQLWFLSSGLSLIDEVKKTIAPDSELASAKETMRKTTVAKLAVETAGIGMILLGGSVMVVSPLMIVGAGLGAWRLYQQRGIAEQTILIKINEVQGCIAEGARLASEGNPAGAVASYNQALLAQKRLNGLLDVNSKKEERYNKLPEIYGNLEGLQRQLGRDQSADHFRAQHQKALADRNPPVAPHSWFWPFR